MDYAEYFLDPSAEIRVQRDRLPHWYQKGNRIYALTFRLADSIPRKMMEEIECDRRAWLKDHPQPWSPEVKLEFDREFRRYEFELMDKGLGACILADPKIRHLMKDVSAFFEGKRHHHISWVIMPNHIHALTLLYEGWEPGQIVASWKKAGTSAANRIANSQGTIWWDGYYDTQIRDTKHLHNSIRYIRKNPVKAGIENSRFALFENEYAKSIGESM